jgi:hypothetical protein
MAGRARRMLDGCRCDGAWSEMKMQVEEVEWETT